VGVGNGEGGNVREVGCGRSVGKSLFTSDDLWQVAQSRGEDRPPVEGKLDWDDVLRQRLGSYAAEGIEPAPSGAPSVWDRRAPALAHLAGRGPGEVAATSQADP